MHARLFRQGQDVNKSSVFNALQFAATHKANVQTKQNAHMASTHTAHVSVHMIEIDGLRQKPEINGVWKCQHVALGHNCSGERLLVISKSMSQSYL